MRSQACSKERGFWSPKRQRNRSALAATVVALVGVMAGGCGSATAPSPSPPAGVPDALAAGFTLAGDPESPAGATWTFRGTLDGVAYDLQGVLLKPRSPSPHPAVIISHGAGGNANGYARAIAQEMVQWGLVTIATNYTHAGGVPIGAPGTLTEPGASPSNLLRGHLAFDILRLVGYVDMRRVALHGHSMGAFVTAALAGRYPGDFRVASHTAGGVRLGITLLEAAAPVESQVIGIRAPYQMHHGDRDFVVPLAMDERLASILRSAGVANELRVYPGADHDDLSRSSAVLGEIRTWYAAHGVL
jgi:dienelactone hydrolase